MAANTTISWTKHTFNIAWGCAKVSAGCKNCYADTLTRRWKYDVWGENKPRRTFESNHWQGPLRWNRAAQEANQRARVFCGSMCDWLEAHPTIDAERQKLWPLICQTPWLDWLLLTKRAERIADNLPHDWGQGYNNVWLGVSVENQENAWRFNEHLSKIPAAVRFISYEPALGPVSDLDWQNLDWLIYGGESGRDFRPHDVSWARQAKAKCDEHRIAFFYKQGNGIKAGNDKLLNGEIIQQYPKPRLWCQNTMAA